MLVKRFFVVHQCTELEVCMPAHPEDTAHFLSHIIDPVTLTIDILYGVMHHPCHLLPSC